MNEQANIDLVKQGYDAFGRSDIQRLLSLFTPDIEWELPEVEGIPFTGKRRGLDQVTEFFRIMNDCQEVREFSPDRYFARGDLVVVQGHAAFTVRDTGIDYRDDWCHIFRVAGGRIAGFREYSDTYQAAQAYRPQGLGATAATAATRPSMH